MSKKTNHLNVLKMYYYPVYRIDKNLPQFFRNLKWAYQRTVRGYCDSDVWDMDSWLADIIAGAVGDLARNSNSYPNGMTMDEWREYLIEVQKCFSQYTEEWDNPINFFSFFNDDLSVDNSEQGRALSKQYFDNEREHQKEIHEKIAKGFNMLVNKYGDLWD